MMSIPTPTATATPAANGTEPGGSVATTAAATTTGPAGFMALFGSLLQGTAPPNPTSPLAVTTLPVATALPPGALGLCLDVPAAENAPPATASSMEGEPADEATADLLASLGLVQLLPTPATPSPAPQAPVPPESASPAEASELEIQKAAALGAAAAALMATAAPVTNVAKAPPVALEGGAKSGETPLEAPSRALKDAPAPPAAPAVVATAVEGAARPQPLIAAAFAALLDDSRTSDGESADISDELAQASGAGGSSSGGSSAGGLQTLNAWATAAHRIASAQDAMPRAALASPEAQLRESVGSPRWKDELGARITLMATQGQQSGSLRLSPEHLGPLEILITVNDDKTTHVQFGAQHAETRTALQEALPRLREMFSSAGLQLGDAGVSGQAPRQRPAEEGAFQAGGYESRSDGELTPAQRPVRSITHSGLLDTYA